MRTARYTLLVVLSILGSIILVARHISLDEREGDHPETRASSSLHSTLSSGRWPDDNDSTRGTGLLAGFSQRLYDRPAHAGSGGGSWWSWNHKDQDQDGNHDEHQYEDQYDHGAEPSPRELWDDIPVSDPSDFWAWTKTENRRLGGQRRRASRGGLMAQGAKPRIRDNLRDDRRYFATGPVGGFNNQFMTIANALWIAQHSDHIPIIFPFIAISFQFGGEDFDIAVSDVFDLDRLRLVLDGPPIVELHELRQYKNEPPHLLSVAYDGEFPQTDSDGLQLQVGDLIPAEEADADDGETLGCWAWGQAFGDAPGVLFRWPEASWTPVPRSVFLAGARPGMHGTDLSDIRRFSNFVADTLSIPEESLAMLDNLSLPHPEVQPDPHLFCVDSVYWQHIQPELSDLHTSWRQGTGVWQSVGQYMKFQPALVRLAEGYLRYLFGTPRDSPLPPFFAVHVRRGDFTPDWLAMDASVWAHAAWEAMQDLHSFGIDVQHVVFTTDERDPEWRAPLLEYGWKFIDHEVAKTGERFGWWLPTLLDAVILSRASGFLGGESSTMSILAYRRVVDWNGGLGRWLSYGHHVPEGWVWTW